MMKVTEQESKELLNKVVRFTEEVERHEFDFETGMLARIRRITKTSDGCPKFLMDFSEFENENRPHMSANYYDSKGHACETWEQQPWYKEQRDKGMYCYVELDALPFDIAEDQVQAPMPTTQDLLNALERTLGALKQRNLGKPCACLDEVIAEAVYALRSSGREAAE